jgi:hypothetical protein
LISRGVRLEYGSLEESLAINAIHQKAELEYLKIMAVVNAIIGVGNQISSSITKSDYTGNDKLNKVLDTLKEVLLPQYKEEQSRKAAKAKDLLSKEVSGGPIRIKVVGKNRHGR